MQALCRICHPAGRFVEICGVASTASGNPGLLPWLVQDKQVTFDGVYLSLCNGLKTATTHIILWKTC
jgi:hypothetical protein